MCNMLFLHVVCARVDGFYGGHIGRQRGTQFVAEVWRCPISKDPWNEKLGRWLCIYIYTKKQLRHIVLPEDMPVGLSGLPLPINLRL